MRVVILAGGMGTRLAEETEVKPKPMVEIGGRPILWHIMKHYAHYGLNDFAVALGYRGEVIKRFFMDYVDLNGHLTLSLGERKVIRREAEMEPWTVHLAETGLETLTGGRLKRLEKLLHDGTFMMTYGDGVSDLNLGRLLEFHRSHGRLATVTAVHPPARYGGLEFEGDRVSRFTEKPREGWISGGFFVLEPGVLDYIKGDDVYWEQEPLERIARDGELMAYRHEGFWQSMDTLRDKRLLQSLWDEGRAPWRVWE